MDKLFEIMQNHPAFDELNSVQLWLVCELIHKVETPLPESESELMEAMAKIMPIGGVYEQ